jgi:hypothetical protein
LVSIGYRHDVNSPFLTLRLPLARRLRFRSLVSFSYAGVFANAVPSWVSFVVATLAICLGSVPVVFFVGALFTQ